MNGTDHCDVTLVCSDGEIKSSKFVLSALSEYFASMFRENNFKESSGVATFNCKKIVMEKVIYYLHGHGLQELKNSLKLDEFSVQDRVDLINMMKMITLENDLSYLEDNFFYLPIMARLPFKDIKSLLFTLEVLDAILKSNLDKSFKITNLMGRNLGKIVNMIQEHKPMLPESVFVALANSTAREVDKLKLHIYLKKTKFSMKKIPKLNLEKFTVKELEREVMASGLFKENAVLKEMVKQLKTLLGKGVIVD